MQKQYIITPLHRAVMDKNAPAIQALLTTTNTTPACIFFDAWIDCPFDVESRQLLTGIVHGMDKNKNNPFPTWKDVVKKLSPSPSAPYSRRMRTMFTMVLEECSHLVSTVPREYLRNNPPTMLNLAALCGSNWHPQRFYDLLDISMSVHGAELIPSIMKKYPLYFPCACQPCQKTTRLDQQVLDLFSRLVDISFECNGHVNDGLGLTVADIQLALQQDIGKSTMRRLCDSRNLYTTIDRNHYTTSRGLIRFNALPLLLSRSF